MSKNKKDTWNIAYFGTPRFAVDVLEELEAAGIEPTLVVTQPDKPQGRGLELKESPVKTWATERGIPVIQPSSLSTEDPATDVLWNGEWDLFIVAAYGKLIPFKVLKLPWAGSLNVHPSLLPKFRGPSPIESQILADEKETGVSIMLIDEELDHGPVIAQASVTPEEWPLRASVLEELLAQAGGELLAEVIPGWISEGTRRSETWTMDDGATLEDPGPAFAPEPQDHGKATFTKKIEKEDGLLDLSADGYQNYLKFCAYDEWPGTYFFTERAGKNIRVKIADAEYKDGTFSILRVVPEGKKEMDYQDFLRGMR